MAQYIDKDVLVEELKYRIKECYRLANIAADNNLYNTLQAIKLLIEQYEGLLDYLDYLEVKEIDLEKETDKEWNKCEPIDEGMGLEITSIEHEQFDNIAKHFYKLGLKARKIE